MASKLFTFKGEQDNSKLPNSRRHMHMDQLEHIMANHDDFFAGGVGREHRVRCDKLHRFQRIRIRAGGEGGRFLG